MWTCPKCQERHDDPLEICWNCGTSKEGVEDATFSRVDEGEQTAESDAQSITADQPTGRSRRHTEARTIADLIYVGLSGYALALDRDTGETVWSCSEMRSGYVTLLLDGDRLIVSTNGYMYCLDPLTGEVRWHNPLAGYGAAPASLISVRGQSSSSLLQQAADEIARSDG